MPGSDDEGDNNTSSVNNQGNSSQNQRQQKVIIPPPEIKAIIDKTSSYVAKNGSSFEQLIMKVEANNPKFNFLRYDDDPYRPYYVQKTLEFQGVVPAGTKVTQEQPKEENGVPVDGTQNKENEDQTIDQQQQDLKPVQDGVPSTNQTTTGWNQQALAQVINRENEYQRQLKQMIFGDLEERKADLRPPHPDQFNISHPVLANIDLDIIKLTAQFVSRNGQKFLQGLTERESRNPQFDFLKPTHGLFGYFTQLVESYSKVLIPRNEQLQKLQRYATDKIEVLKTGGERFLWEKNQEEERAAKGGEQAEIDAQREDDQMQVDTIDWHDFVVVEKIDLYDDEEMRNIEAQGDSDEEDEEDQQQKKQVSEQIRQKIEENLQFMNMPPSGALGQQQPQVVTKQNEGPKEVLISSALDPQMKIVKNYEKKPEEKKSTGVQKCPKCQQDIPVSEWREHMKLELMDPKWREEKLKNQEKAKLNSLASGDEIAQNLRRFANERKDIFRGTSAQETLPSEQTVISSQQPSQQPQPRIIWDGQATNITRTTANIAMLQHQQQKNLQEAYMQRGELDPKSMERLQQQNMLPANVKNIQSAILQQDQPRQGAGSQKQRPEDDEDLSLAILQQTLRSEAEWLRLYPGKLNIQIRTPVSQENPGWNLKGQVIPLTVESRVTIGQLKESLSQILGQMPSSSMRVRGAQNLALKDNLTLAFYNIPDGTILDLAIKDRSGSSTGIKKK